MTTTDFATGSPCWIDLGATDTDAAVAFYGAVFGWEYHPFGPEPGGYGAFRSGGRTVAAVGPLTEEGARPSWTVYFATPDAEKTASTVRRAGGTVRVEPGDVGGEGRLAQFTDPVGADFAVWQPGATRGLERTGDPGSLTWIELCTSDVAALVEFYRALFGWTTSDVPLPGGGGVYSLIIPQDGNVGQAQGGMVQLDADSMREEGGPYWHPVFEVADCDATIARVTDNGGKVRMGPEDAEGVGRLAVCLDGSGAEFVVLTSAGE
ncbi:hypothetical protein FHX37_3977 [Haloactinospora alba]|uniref:VOC domain-containing protein n=1 Tax=Haloactinospora alba TaxID=405555 RepID=A0A543N9Y2_9ACTN|nr:VOC family protein [Haloactinospora alba]TQN28620.1 hypothetical protein FHX37_3977 [Haloactinospora alba]